MDDKKTPPAEQPEELSDDQAEQAAGGAIHIKATGVDGDTKATAAPPERQGRP